MKRILLSILYGAAAFCAMVGAAVIGLFVANILPSLF